MMTFRSLLLLGILIAAGSGPAPAQSLDDVISSPVLRAEVNVTGDVVRIGDVIDNAGPAAQIAIYRAPDLGTSGKLPVAQVLAALRAHRVIGVATGEIKEISVTRLARTLEARDIETQIASALEHRGGLGDAANLSLTFDRDVQTMQLDASNTGAMQLVANRFEPRSGRFDLTFEIGNDAGLAATRLRFTGTAIETVEAAVLARGVERSEILKSSDVIVERRPKAEVGNDFAGRNRAVGMQARRQLRAGQALRLADLAKPDLVQRDQPVMLVYQSAGLYLTIRGKALEGGTEGDVVSVLNLQSKRTVSGIVTGRGQVSVAVPTPTAPPPSDANAASDASATTGTAGNTAAVSVATNDNATVSRKAE
jgi:flagella basal body P-ring formation protein FlgA